MAAPVATEAHAPPNAVGAPRTTALARLGAIGLWLLSTTVTLAAPAVMTVLLFDRGGWAWVAGIAFLVALLLIAPIAALAWALHVALCAFVAASRRRNGSTSPVLDAAFGAGLATVIWIPLLVAGAGVFELEPTDRSGWMILASVVSGVLLIGTFDGACLGVLANRRAQPSSSAAR